VCVGACMCVLCVVDGVGSCPAMAKGAGVVACASLTPPPPFCVSSSFCCCCCCYFCDIHRLSTQHTPSLARLISELPTDVAITRRDDDPLTRGPSSRRMPAVVTGGSLLTAEVWRGYCRATRAADVMLWKIGEHVCDMTSPTAAGYNQGDAATHGCSCSGDPDRVLCRPRLFTCGVSHSLAPGYYNTTINMLGSGTAVNHNVLFGDDGTTLYDTHRVAASTGAVHDVQVVPRITRVSAHSGSVRGGQLLHIYGSSFQSANANANANPNPVTTTSEAPTGTVVDINGAPCRVVAVTPDHITCRTTAQTYVTSPATPPPGSTVHNPAAPAKGCEVHWASDGGVGAASSGDPAGLFHHERWGNEVWNSEPQVAAADSPWVSFTFGAGNASFGARRRFPISSYSFQFPVHRISEWRLEGSNPDDDGDGAWHVLANVTDYTWGEGYWLWSPQLPVIEGTDAAAYSSFRLVFPGRTQVTIAGFRVYSPAACAGFQRLGRASFAGGRGARRWVVSMQPSHRGCVVFVLLWCGWCWCGWWWCGCWWCGWWWCGWWCAVVLLHCGVVVLLCCCVVVLCVCVANVVVGRRRNDQTVLQHITQDGAAGLPEDFDRALVFRGPLYGPQGWASDVLEEVGSCNDGSMAGHCPGQHIAGQHVVEAFFRPVSTGPHFFFLTTYSRKPTTLVIANDTSREHGVVMNITRPANSWGSAFKWFSQAGQQIGQHKHGVHLQAGRLYYMRLGVEMDVSRGFLNLGLRAPPINASAPCTTKSLFRQLQEERYPELRGSCDLFFEPVPGDMLFTREAAPQVHVTVDGIAASCASGGTCDYLSVTHPPPAAGGSDGLPVVAAAAVTYAPDGRSATVNLTLATAADNNNNNNNNNNNGAVASNSSSVVVVARAATTHALFKAHAAPPPAFCSASAAGAGAGAGALASRHVVCVADLAHAAPGNHSLELLTPTAGYALHASAAVSAAMTLSVTPHVLNAPPSPPTGSVAGGTTVRLAGRGLGWAVRDFGVTVGGAPCTRLRVAPTELTCVTPASPLGGGGGGGTGTADVVVSWRGQVVSTAGVFNYTTAATPAVAALSPPAASSAFASTLTLTGTNFGAGSSPADVRVTLGSNVCAVSSVSDTQIVCVAPAQAPGDYPLSVHVAGRGTALVDLSGGSSSSRRRLLRDFLPAAVADGGASVTVTDGPAPHATAQDNRGGGGGGGGAAAAESPWPFASAHLRVASGRRQARLRGRRTSSSSSDSSDGGDSRGSRQQSGGDAAGDHTSVDGWHGHGIQGLTQRVADVLGFAPPLPGGGRSVVSSTPSTPSAPSRGGRSLSAAEDAARLVQYELRVDDVYPRQGSVAGGTAVTVVGAGFSPRMEQNIITLGYGVCDPTFANHTHLRCVTRREWPDMVAEPALLQVPQSAPSPVRVEVRQFQSKCTMAGGCTFNHSSHLTPVVASNATYAATNGTVTVSGSNLLPDGAGSASRLRLYVAPHRRKDMYSACHRATVRVRNGWSLAAEFWLRGERLGVRLGRGINVVVLNPDSQRFVAHEVFYPYVPSLHWT